MTPGSVAMLLGETTGLRVQTTAPSLGAANVRIQGLRGHYSPLLADGLPLYGAQGDSFSLLQVPPLDLGQVEVIKGVASALYGASALGGVVNLVSRRPPGAEEELLLNATTLGGVDGTGWVARRRPVVVVRDRRLPRADSARTWTATAGRAWPATTAACSVRGSSSTTIAARRSWPRAGVIAENREGGTTEAALAPDGRPFPESLRTRHVDVGGVAKWLASSRLVTVRGSLLRTRPGPRVRRRPRAAAAHLTWFGEGSVTGTSGRHTWVAGAAFQQDRYGATELPQFDYVFSAPAVFAQDEVRLGRALDARGQRAGGFPLRIRHAGEPAPVAAGAAERELDAASVRRPRRLRSHALHRGDRRDGPRPAAPPVRSTGGARVGGVRGRQLPPGSMGAVGHRLRLHRRARDTARNGWSDRRRAGQSVGTDPHLRHRADRTVPRRGAHGHADARLDAVQRARRGYGPTPRGAVDAAPLRLPERDLGERAPRQHRNRGLLRRQAGTRGRSLPAFRARPTSSWAPWRGGASARCWCSSTRRTSWTSVRRARSRWCCRRGGPTGAGSSTPGRRWTAASSTGASA